MSRILKSPRLAGAAAPAGAFSLADFEEEAARIVAEAERRAGSILAAAGADAGRLRAAAREEGLAAGREEGRAAGRREGLDAGRSEAIEEIRREGARALAALEEVVRELNSRAGELARAAEEDVLTFALAVAEKILRREVREAPEEVFRLVREGVRMVGEAGEITVALSPEDLDLLRELGAEAAAGAPPGARVRLAADAEVARGGCRVTGGTRGGAGGDEWPLEVDLSVQKQLDRIEAALLGRADGEETDTAKTDTAKTDTAETDTVEGEE